MTTALLLIDLQNDYFPGGAMELAGSVEAARNAAMLLAAFRDRQLPVVHVQHVSTRAGATFFLPGTRGVAIHEGVAPRSGETVVQKHFPNGFRDTPLLQHLHERKITDLVIAGMMTHLCVDTTTRAAADLGFRCRLAHDACATRSLSFGTTTVAAADVQAAFMASLNGPFANVASAREICAAL